MLFYILLFFHLLLERLTILRLPTPESHIKKNMKYVGAVHLYHLYIQHTPANDGYFDRNYDPLANITFICFLSAIKNIMFLLPCPHTAAQKEVTDAPTPSVVYIIIGPNIAIIALHIITYKIKINHQSSPSLSMSLCFLPQAPLPSWVYVIWLIDWTNLWRSYKTKNQ